MLLRISENVKRKIVFENGLSRQPFYRRPSGGGTGQPDGWDKSGQPLIKF
jgi:hypothetical protein